MSEQELNDLVEIAHTVASQDELISVCHRILRSVGKVLNVDRASLFVYSKDALGNEKLISHLFDITPEDEDHDAIKRVNRSMEISLNDSSILGQVALTREARIVNKAYEYANFNRRVDAETKFTTQSILCLPILEPGQNKEKNNNNNSILNIKQANQKRLFGVTQLLRLARKLIIEIENESSMFYFHFLFVNFLFMYNLLPSSFQTNGTSTAD